jgi:hypothetical protein
MKTQVVMKRPLFDGQISQKSTNGFLSKNDILATGNKWRLINGHKLFDFNGWIRTENTQIFIAELEKQFSCKALESGRGRNATTWLHPYLFIDLALAISPKLKLEVYGWLYDELLKYRNFSGDSYKKMCGAIWVRTPSKSTFAKDIAKVADYIKIECEVKDWQTASEAQLRLRDRIHENIALLVEVMNNINEAIRLGILKAKNN